MEVSSTPFYQASSGAAMAGSGASEKMNALPGASQLNSDFLTMLVTQIKYQDPMDPMDNSQMTSQLAQLSELTLLERIDESMAKMALKNDKESLADLSAIVDRMVSIPMQPEELVGFTIGQQSSPEEMQVNILSPHGKENIAVRIMNESGEEIARKFFVTDAVGQLHFSVSDLSENSWPAGNYHLDFVAQNGELEKALEARVRGVTLASPGQSPFLDLAGMSQVEMSRVQAVKH